MKLEDILEMVSKEELLAMKAKNEEQKKKLDAAKAKLDKTKARMQNKDGYDDRSVRGVKRVRR